MIAVLICGLMGSDAAGDEDDLVAFQGSNDSVKFPDFRLSKFETNDLERVLEPLLTSLCPTCVSPIRDPKVDCV